MVTRQTHDTDLGRRHQIKHAIEHAQAGAQNRHHGELFALDLPHLDRTTPTFDGDFLGLQITGRFIRQEARQFFGQDTELVGADIRLAQQRQFVLHQRMVNNGNLHGIALQKTLGASVPWNTLVRTAS